MAHPHLARADSSILVIVDYQEPFARGMEDSGPVADNIITLAHVAKIVGVPILVTEQSPEKLGPTIPKLQDPLSELGVYDPIPKVSFSCCGSEDFVQRVYDSGRDTLIITGIETHVCVQQTALDLASRDYDVYVCADAVGSRGRIDHEQALARMRQEGVWVTTVESVLFELCSRCDAARFKPMLEVI
ncbi:MAG: hydrolase, partial [Chloroflexi bacterium]|nr:hydrolase [Chloroflexota bacterium]